MIKSVTDYLDSSARKYPDKVAFVDVHRSITFAELNNEAKKIAQYLMDKSLFKCPIIVHLDKSVECIASFMGIAYSGNFYTPIDTHMPQDRKKKIVDVLKPKAIITDDVHFEEMREITDTQIITYNELMGTLLNERQLDCVSKTVIDTDILYVLFTSGSTGVPKGVIINHRSVIDFTEWMTEHFQFDENTVFGNQAQLYFDLSIQDIYCTLKNAGTTVLIPNRFFAAPIKVWKILLKYNVNVLVWIPSILCLFANMDILPHVEKLHLRRVLFCGEVMPTKQLNIWRRNYPDTCYTNLYGPTECTEACMFYEIDRVFSDDEILPIGHACENIHVFILDEQGSLIIKPHVIGELYVRGTTVGMGYYGNDEKTQEAFVQNPLNPDYPEIVYKTGDLVCYDDDYNIMYVARKDFQIKHRGYRIELGEIEAATYSIPEVEYACCVYNNDCDEIALIYTGGGIINLKEVLKKKLPEYMIPQKIIHRDTMLFNVNGKVDRNAIYKTVWE